MSLEYVTQNYGEISNFIFGEITVCSHFIYGEMDLVMIRNTIVPMKHIETLWSNV